MISVKEEGAIIIVFCILIREEKRQLMNTERPAKLSPGKGKHEDSGERTSTWTYVFAAGTKCTFLGPVKAENI